MLVDGKHVATISGASEGGGSVMFDNKEKVRSHQIRKRLGSVEVRLG